MMSRNENFGMTPQNVVLSSEPQSSTLSLVESSPSASAHAAAAATSLVTSALSHETAVAMRYLRLSLRSSLRAAAQSYTSEECDGLNRKRATESADVYTSRTSAQLTAYYYKAISRNGLAKQGSKSYTNAVNRPTYCINQVNKWAAAARKKVATSWTAEERMAHDIVTLVGFGRLRLTDCLLNSDGVAVDSRGVPVSGVRGIVTSIRARLGYEEKQAKAAARAKRAEDKQAKSDAKAVTAADKAVAALVATGLFTPEAAAAILAQRAG